MGMWIRILHSANGNRLRVLCSECDTAFEAAADECPSCKVRMAFDPALPYRKERKE